MRERILLGEEEMKGDVDGGEPWEGFEEGAFGKRVRLRGDWRGSGGRGGSLEVEGGRNNLELLPRCSSTSPSFTPSSNAPR